MSEVSRNGRTVIFVSHNMSAVQNLCSRVVWLAGGQVVKEGEPAGLINEYLRTTMTAMSQQNWSTPSQAPGNDRVRLHRAAVFPADGALLDQLTVQTPLRMEFEYWSLTPGAPLTLSVVLQTEEGYPIFSTACAVDSLSQGASPAVGLFRSSFDIPANLLNDGVHRVRLDILDGAQKVPFHFDDILIFEVVDAPEDRSAGFGKRIGAVRPRFTWRTGFASEQVPGITGPDVDEPRSSAAATDSESRLPVDSMNAS